MSSFQLLEHQAELVAKLGDPSLSGRLIGDELLLWAPGRHTKL